MARKPYYWDTPRASVPIKNTPFCVKIFFDYSLRIFDRRTALWMNYKQWREVIETDHFTPKEKKFLHLFLQRYPSELDARIYFAESMIKRQLPYYSRWMTEYLQELKRQKEMLENEDS